MIELQHINKVYNRGAANEVHALSDLSLNIDAGQFVVVAGTNGSGKTSLLNIVAGSADVTNGQLLIDGNNVTGWAEYRRSKWVARIFQNPLMGTSPDLSVLENFRLAALRTQKKKFTVGTGEKFRSLVKDKIASLHLGLENKTDQPMGTLSGGQRQALTLLMAVMDEPKILLMDEPAAALDPKTSELLMELSGKIIREFRLTALLVTHRVKDVLMYGDRILFMQEGKIVKDLDQQQKTKLQLQDVLGWF